MTIMDHPAVNLSQRELDLIEAGEHMDNMIDQAAEMLMQYGPDDEDYLKLAELERAARSAFTYAQRQVLKERRARVR